MFQVFSQETEKSIIYIAVTYYEIKLIVFFED